MALKSKTIKITSVVVNKEFLEKLGNIIEKEIEYRKTKDHDGWIVDIPRVKYTVDAGDERIEYFSMKELLSEQFFPQKINSIIFRVNNSDTKCLNISLSLNNNHDYLSDCGFSSRDESKILSFEKEIKNLFAEYETDYGWLFKLPWFNSALPGLLLFASLLALLSKLTKLMHLSGDMTFPVLLVSVIAAWSIGSLFKFLYPFYSFELSNKDRSRTLLKGALLAVISTITLNTIYDIIKWAISQ